MKLSPLGEMHLTYVGASLDFVDYGFGGQYYASIEGSWQSERISGRLRLTNIAQKRADNVNTPTLRGVMETEDGATLFVEMNGLSQVEQGGRVFVSSLTLRTAHSRYQWVNTLFGVVEGELHGPPRPNEFRVRCRVFACEATITPAAGGDGSMQIIAYAMPVLPDKEAALQSLVREMGSRSSEFDDSRRQLGVTREAVFLQRTPHGSQIITYREVGNSSGSQPTTPSNFEAWMKDRVSAVSGFDPAVEPPPKVELLLRQRPVHRGDLYAAALPLLPGKTAHLHQWTSEINGIHAAEFEESLRRLGFGLTLFVQYSPQLDLAISVVEGDDPSSALTKLVASQHPFDRWHAQQIADQSGLDFAAPLPQPNELLWSWDKVAAHASAT
ncbi:MAG: DUF3237 domain-containing protein [Candidatus Dormibacteraeota bacterium]|nr:DUF3237 domain-containing protein [Candidatus Dormibacteraeota bacterium]